jgi:hypothetical protein
VKSGQDKHSGLSHTGLGLADDIHTQKGLRDALVLHYRLK